MASENLDCNPKISNNKKCKTFLKPATRGMYSLIFFKAKNEEILPKNYFYYCLDQKPFTHFWKIKKSKKGLNHSTLPPIPPLFCLLQRAGSESS